MIADLHAHPAKYKDIDATLDMLCSPGLVGLAFAHCMADKVLTYEEVLMKFFPLIDEIDKNALARIRSLHRIGYFTRTQELDCWPHHILAIGFEGSYLPDYIDARKAVEEIHKRNGIAILNHPYTTPDKGAKVIKYRYITPKEEESALELCDMVDEIEVFNAQNINPTFGIIISNMKIANVLAQLLAKKYKFKGIVSSDAHYRTKQAKICGIELEDDTLCIEKLKHDIKTGNFENSNRKYVSRISFIKGMFLK